METLYQKTPIGKIAVPDWESKKLIDLSDEELLFKAITEHKKFCISPATFAMVEKRFLGRTLQQLINPNVGLRHSLLNT